jgi:hypothetical protein
MMHCKIMLNIKFQLEHDCIWLKLSSCRLSVSVSFFHFSSSWYVIQDESRKKHYNACCTALLLPEL